jgi:hypothetical protein
MKRVRVFVLALAMGLAACATPADYHARTPAAADGYSEQRLDDTRWRVEFVGDASASQERVESYLLYRAAELTAARGYDWFLASNHSGETESEIVVEAPPRSAPQSSVWRPLWRHRSRFRWSDWMVRGPDPGEHLEARSGRTFTIDRYAAREDIVMGLGEAPNGAFAAQDVLALVGPTIVRPRSGE